MIGGIDKVKRIALEGSFRFVALNNDAGARVVNMNTSGANFQNTFDKIVNLLESGILPQGYYSVIFKDKLGTKAPGFTEKIYIGADAPKIINIDTPTLKDNSMDKDEEMSLREEIIKLRYENEALKKELEESTLEDAPDNTTVVTIAETVKSLLSEVVVPIVSKVMEQRERKVVALEAAAAAAKTPVYTPPAPSFQVRPGYVYSSTRPTQAQPLPGAASGVNPGASGAPGGGGSVPNLPDDMTESQYLEAIKHLTFEELQSYYNAIKATGRKIDLSYFLAVVREVREDDLLPLIDEDVKGAANE